MKKRTPFLLYSLISGLLFALFTFAVRDDLLNKLDFDLAVKIQNKTPRLLDTYLSFFSSLSRFETMLVIVILIVLLHRSLASVIGFVGFIALHIIGLFGKLFLTHPAPPHMFYRGTPSQSIFPPEYVQTQSSYPSGHSMRAVYVGLFLAGLIWSSNLSSKIKLVLTCLISLIVSLVLFTRVSLGEHWTSDVIGGALWGATLGFFALVFYRTSKNKRKTHHSSVLP